MLNLNKPIQSYLLVYDKFCHETVIHSVSEVMTDGETDNEPVSPPFNLDTVERSTGLETLTTGSNRLNWSILVSKNCFGLT